VSELARRILDLTADGRDVSVRRASFVFWGEGHSFDALVLAFAELLDAEQIERSAPGRYRRCYGAG